MYRVFVKCLPLVLFLSCAVAVAQNGEFTGQVTDPQGAAVANAAVQIVNRDSFAKREAKTNDAGQYAVTYLPAGHYEVMVNAEGFSPSVTDDLILTSGQSVVLNVQLLVAGTTGSINVEGQRAAQVETENAQVSGTITQKEVVSLGLNGRNFTQLIALAPGVSNQTGQDEAKVGVVGSVKYSVNGGRVEYNSFEVDGSDVLNTGLNGAASTLMVYPSLDSIQEVKVLTSNYGAMYGRTASGTVLVTTKSGGSALHGNIYEFLRNEAFNSRNYFDQTKNAPLYRRHDFGGTIGGPVYIPGIYNSKRDRTFFFFSEEFRLEKTPTDYNQAVPSLKERGLIATPKGVQLNTMPTPDGSGRIQQVFDFSDVCPASGTGDFVRQQFPDCPAVSQGTSGPGSLSPFPSNNLEGVGGATGPSPYGVDKNALALLYSNLIPLPNSSKGCNFRVISIDPTDPNHCYNTTISPSTYWREELFRIDHNFDANLKASVHYIHDAWDTTVLTPQWGVIRNSFPTVQNRFVGPGTSIVARLTDAITPTLLNEFTVSYANSTITLTDQNGPGGARFQRNPVLDQPLVPNPRFPGECDSSVSVDPISLIPQCAVGYFFKNGFGGKMPGLDFTGTNAAYGGRGFAVDPSYMPWSHTNPTYSVRDDISKALGKHTLQFGALFVLAQRNQTNNAIGTATGDLQGLLTFSNSNNIVQSTGNAFADFLYQADSAGNVRDFIQSFTQDSAQHRYYQRYQIGEMYVQDDWRATPHLTLNLGLRVSLFGTYQEKNHNAWNWEASKFNKSAFVVDPAYGGLLDAATLRPVPFNPNTSQLDPQVVTNLGLVQCGTRGVPAGCMQGHLFNPAPRIGFAWDPRGNGKTAIRGGYGIFFEHGTGNEANTGSLEASSPLVLNMTQNLPHSYPCIGNIGYGPTVDPTNQGCANSLFGTSPSQGAYPINVTAIPTQAVWPYAQQWSFGIQQELPRDFVVSLAYVGSKGTHLTTELQLNQLKPLSNNQNPFAQREPLTSADCSVQDTNNAGGDIEGLPFTLQNGAVVTAGDPAYVHLRAACSSYLTPDLNSLQGRPYPGLGKIFSLQNVANSNYEALQATLRRTRGALTAGISYSYSHSIDNSSDRSDPVLPDSYNLQANRASSNFDQRHLLNMSYVYQLPLTGLIPAIREWLNEDVSGNDSENESQPKPTPPGPPSPLVQHILGNWELSGITIFQSGAPFSVINSTGNTGVSLADNAGVSSGLGVAPSYPDVVRPALLRPTDNPQSFGPLLGNPSQFVAPRGLTFGNAGRNFLSNPSRLNFDMALLKHFKIRESGELEFRAEAFNVFNHTQFRIYDADNPGSSGNNIVSCYAGPVYSAGFQSNGGADCVTGASFLHPIDAHRPRTLQLGLKLSF